MWRIRPPHTPAYEELMEVITHAVAKLNIEWPARRKKFSLLVHNKGLPFYHDVHTEVWKSWNKHFSYRVYFPATSNYDNILGGKTSGCDAMPKVEETLASNLLLETVSSLKAPTLPTKPVRTTLVLVGKAHSAAGQAVSCLHTMSV